MKKAIMAAAVIAVLCFGGCSSQQEADTSPKEFDQGRVAAKIVIGEELKPFTLDDQFERPHTLDKDTKKVIFVFTKAMGHMVKGYLNNKPLSYLKERSTLFVADVSPMPSIIRNVFAIPDLQEHKYPVLLILDEKFSQSYQNAEQKEKIMIVTLDNFKVEKVEFVATEGDFKKAMN